MNGILKPIDYIENRYLWILNMHTKHTQKKNQLNIAAS